MASTLPGVLVSEIRGKVDDKVFGRNAYGDYVRQNVPSPVQNTTWQGQMKTRMNAARNRWKAITDAQRLAWIAAAASGDWDYSGRRGKVIRPTGQALFLRLNVKAYNYSFPMDTPPARRVIPSSKIPVPTSVAVVPASSVIVNFSTSTLETMTAAAIYSTAVNSAGIMRPKESLFKRCYTAPWDAFGSSLEIYPQVFQRFGTLASTGKLYIRVELVDYQTGLGMWTGQVFKVI